jgi:uncharacterized DUF497 family protein
MRMASLGSRGAVGDLRGTPEGAPNAWTRQDSRRPRLLYVVHAEVRHDVIRIISARKATSHEKARYEND